MFNKEERKVANLLKKELKNLNIDFDLFVSETRGVRELYVSRICLVISHEKVKVLNKSDFIEFFIKDIKKISIEKANFRTYIYIELNNSLKYSVSID